MARTPQPAERPPSRPSRPRCSLSRRLGWPFHLCLHLANLRKRRCPPLWLPLGGLRRRLRARRLRNPRRPLSRPQEPASVLLLLTARHRGPRARPTRHGRDRHSSLRLPPLHRCRAANHHSSSHHPSIRSAKTGSLPTGPCAIREATFRFPSHHLRFRAVGALRPRLGTESRCPQQQLPCLRQAMAFFQRFAARTVGTTVPERFWTTSVVLESASRVGVRARLAWPNGEQGLLRSRGSPCDDSSPCGSD